MGPAISTRPHQCLFAQSVALAPVDGMGVIGGRSQVGSAPGGQPDLIRRRPANCQPAHRLRPSFLPSRERDHSTLRVPRRDRLADRRSEIVQLVETDDLADRREGLVAQAAAEELPLDVSSGVVDITRPAKDEPVESVTVTAALTDAICQLHPRDLAYIGGEITRARTICHVGTSFRFRPGPGVFAHRRGHLLDISNIAEWLGMSNYHDRMRVDPADLIDSAEAADLLGLAGGNVVTVYLSRYADFPRPVVDRGRCRLWLRADIQHWGTGRNKGATQRD